ncbi:ABC transporter ATP-binding protein [Desulfosporosinus lacus]|uniref:Putative ABC transport system ATP-binding protein n=1 Tax=Desulfosporosinus lacus DSM 15449 TaxID=1121420 RepID=A0A1M5ZSY3_9FIRM|nr:ABC transporter ATP-binding protein [Desulfosporosinus lacus]SHI27043.1 putative ABC transport system ATP-binding protein [Desulfosporosinus lacus DSM 15449]
MNIIELNNVSKTYGNKIVLDKFSLQINEGDFIAIMGPSGSGKSTLLNIIGLLEKVDAGNVIIDGAINIHTNSSKSTRILREKIAYLFQNFALIDEETVQYNLNLALKYFHGTKKDRLVQLKKTLNFVGLEGYEKRKIYELSGGEQQRVSIARLMLKPSKIILADEPTGSLDEQNRDLILDYLEKLNSEGKTIVLVTHDYYVASKCCKVINL